MSLTASQIEDAIVTALAPLLVQNGGKARSIASYGAQFEKAAEGAGQIRLIMPAVLVAHSGSEYDPSSAPSFDRTFKFRLYHASAAPSSELARRREAMELMEASRAILNGSSLGLSITPLVVGQESLIPSGEALSLFAADYRASAIETVLNP